MFACAQYLLVQDGNQQLQSYVHHCLAFYSASFHFSITELQVTSPTDRQKAFLMFINLVRWVRPVHEQHVLPVHRHQLFRNMRRPSPYLGECRSSRNVPCCGAAALDSRPHPLRMSCLRCSLLFLQDVFTCNSSYDMSNSIVLIYRTCQISPCKSSDTESESCQEEFCSAISPPWYLAPDIQAACFWNHSWCLSGRQVGGAMFLLCSLCHLFTCFKYFSLVVTKVATP